MLYCPKCWQGPSAPETGKSERIASCLAILQIAYIMYYNVCNYLQLCKKLFAFQASLTYIQQAKLQIIIYFQMYYKKSNYVGSVGTCCIKSNTAQHLPQLLVSFPSSNIIGTQFNASVTNNKVEDTPFPHLLIFFQLQLMAHVTP